MGKFLLMCFAFIPVIVNAQVDSESIFYRALTVQSENGEIAVQLNNVRVNAELNLPDNALFDIGTIRWEFSFGSVASLIYKGVNIPLSEVPSFEDNAIQIDDLRADIYVGASPINANLKIGGVGNYAQISKRSTRDSKVIDDNTFGLNFSNSQDVEKYKEYYKRGITLTNLRLRASYAGMLNTTGSEMEDYLKKQQYDQVVAEADQIFSQGNYETAKEKYRDALRLKFGDEYARSKIKEIDTLLAEQKAEEEYVSAMQNAEQATNTDEKIRFYNEALRIKPDDAEASEAIRTLTSANEGEKTEGGINGGSGTGSGVGTAAGTVAGSGTDSETETNETQQKSAAEVEQQKRQREQEARERERQKQQELAEAREEYQRKNAAIAASSAAASAGFLYFIGGMIYGDMGTVDVENIFVDQGFYLGLTYGYSTNFQPIFFNVDSDLGGSVEETDARYAWTTNIDLQFNVGYESKMIGGYGYINPYGGFSPIFDTYTYSLNYGGRIFAGLENLKGYYDLSRGERYIYKFDYLTGDSGTGEIFHKYIRHEYGLMITVPSNKRFIRNHLMFGLVTDQILNLTDEFDTYSSVQNIEEEGLTILSPANFSSQIVTGFTFQFKRDQHFNLYLNVFPEYPYTGDRKYGFSEEARDQGKGILLEIGFVRALDQWK